MGEKFEKFKGAIADKTAKVVAFTRRHPVLTIIASNIVVAAVSGGVAYAKTKGGMSVDWEAMDVKESETDNAIYGKHAFIVGEGYFYDKELDGYFNGAPSDRINDIARGIERMNLDNGDAIFTMKTGENSYESIMIEEPDIAVLTMDDIVKDFDGHCNRYDC